jgi:hypothetical protein
VLKETAMKRISSKTTFFYKLVFPTVWFGFLGIFIFLSLFGERQADRMDVMLFIVPVFMAAFGYFIMRKLLFDLIDEVYDEGDSLLFKNRRKEVRVGLGEIKNVSYSPMVSPPRVTISLRTKTDLGDELSFSPPMSVIPFKKSQDIMELIDRIDQARLK